MTLSIITANYRCLSHIKTGPNNDPSDLEGKENITKSQIVLVGSLLQHGDFPLG